MSSPQRPVVNEQSEQNNHADDDAQDNTHEIHGRDNLTSRQKFCFSVGHIQNDLQAFAAISYLLLFLTKVAGLENKSTGTVFLAAQITDGSLSPFLGYLCDRYDFPGLSRFGKRKAWHLFGVAVQLVFSPFLFVRCLACEFTTEEWRETVAVAYYSFIVIGINIGFAAIQISHLALLPEIARKPRDHMKLNSFRTAWTFISGVIVYGVFWFLLGENSGKKISFEDRNEFMYLGFIITAVGFVFTVIFHVGVNENKIKTAKRPMDQTASNNNETTETTGISTKEDVLNEPGNKTVSGNISQGNQSTRNEASSNGRLKSGIIKWFKTPQFFMIAFIYMCSRIVVSISSAYFPFYLEESLDFEKEAIAYFPLLVLVSSAVFTFVAKKIGSHWNTCVAYCIAALVAIGVYHWLHFQPIGGKNAVYGASITMGGGAAMMLVTALTMVAVLIDRKDKTTGAFVYGIMGLTDKVANGIAVHLIQMFKPKTKVDGSCPECGNYIRLVFPLVTGIAAFLSMLVAIATLFIQRKKAKNEHRLQNFQNRMVVLAYENVVVGRTNDIDEHHDDTKL